MALRFRPNDEDIFADSIPYYYNGEYHIFYLRGKEKSTRWPRWKTCWSHIKSTDLVNWEQLPNALEIGEQRFPDGGACFTGSCIERNGVFHIFYTGYHPGHPDGREQILHATSDDLVHFTKDPGYVPVLAPDGKTYLPGNDWRDPSVFWCEEEQQYWMLITSNRVGQNLPYVRSGITGVAKSPDLTHWTLTDPIYQPLGYPALEVNELYRIGDWWYLMFTTFKGRTEYRMGRSPYGPWLCPQFPEVDMSTHFYAGKSLFDGKRRLIFGWCGTLMDGIDSPVVQWGGNMLTPRHVRQAGNGELRFEYPNEFKNQLRLAPVSPQARYGEWNIGEGFIQCDSRHAFSAAVLPNSKGDFALRLKMKCHEGYGKLGVAIHCDERLSQCYYINLDTGKNQLEITHFGYADEPHGVSDACPTISRPIVAQGMGSREVEELLIIKKDSVVEIFLDDGVTATLRCAEIPDGDIALFCEYVNASFTDVAYCRL